MLHAASVTDASASTGAEPEAEPETEDDGVLVPPPQERQWLLQQDRTPEQQAELYASIQQDEVASSMDGVWLDYSYLLAPQATEAKT